MDEQWRLGDPPNVLTITVRSIVERRRPIILVTHDADDGAWQFLGDSMSDGGGAVISCLHHPVDRDPSIAELADLPLGWYAERDRVGEPWTRRKHSTDHASE